MKTLRPFFNWLKRIGSGDTNSTGPGGYPRYGGRAWSYLPPPPPAPPPCPHKPTGVIVDKAEALPPFDAEGCRNYDAGTAQAICKAIEFLRLGDGDSVDILCDNQDFNGQPNNAVECCCEWTDWKPLRFTGNTLLEALQAAVAAKRKA